MLGTTAPPSGWMIGQSAMRIMLIVQLSSSGVYACALPWCGLHAGRVKASRSKASERVGRLVREMRSDATLSRAALAARADMDTSHLARIESGQGNPTLFVLIQLATALEVEPTVFLDGLTAADLPESLKPYSEADFRRELRRRERG